MYTFYSWAETCLRSCQTSVMKAKILNYFLKKIYYVCLTGTGKLPRRNPRKTSVTENYTHGRLSSKKLNSSKSLPQKILLTRFWENNPKVSCSWKVLLREIAVWKSNLIENCASEVLHLQQKNASIQNFFWNIALSGKFL